MNKKVIYTVLSIFLVLILIYLGYLWFSKINKWNINNKILTDEELLDKQIQEYSSNFTWDKIKINKQTNEIDLGFSSRMILKDSENCFINKNMKTCDTQVNQLLSDIKLSVSQWHVFSESTYNTLIDMLVYYNVNSKDLPKFIKSSWVQTLDELYKVNKTKVVEERLKGYMDWVRKDIDDMICRDIKIVDCSNLFYTDYKVKCETLKKSNDVKKKCSL